MKPSYTLQIHRSNPAVLGIIFQKQCVPPKYQFIFVTVGLIVTADYIVEFMKKSV